MSTPRIDRLDRNYIINGGMDFWQRVAGNTTTVNTATASQSYPADRMPTFSNGPTVKNYSTLRSTSVPTAAQVGAQVPYSKRFNCLTAIPSPAAADTVLPFVYYMEGQDAQALFGQTITLGFWVNTNLAGNYSVAFNTWPISPGRSYVTSFNVASGELSTWVFKKVTLTMEASGVIDNTVSMSIYIAGASGSNSQGTQGAWQNGTATTFAGAANIMSANTNFMMLTGVQLVVASDLFPGSFVRAGRTIGQELLLCQRYYEKSYDLEIVPGTASGSSFAGISNTSAGNNLIVNCIYKAFKRAIPSITYYNPNTGAAGSWRDNGGADVAITNYDVKQTGNIAASAGATTNGRIFTGHWTADAEF